MRFYHHYRSDIRDTFSLSLPLIAGQLGQVLVMVSDNIMVGRLGTFELAAISLGVAVFSIFFVVGLGISFALPPLVAEAFGRKDDEGIAASLANSLLVNLVYAFLVLGLTEGFIDHLYRMGQEERVVDYAIPYLRLSVYSMIPFMAFQAYRSLSDGIGDTITSMKALLFGNALNILLNYLLIFGKFGFPELGVYGAGLSSLIARISMVLIWFGLVWRRSHYRTYLNRLDPAMFTRERIRQILSLGVVTSLQMLFEVSIFSGSTFLMGMISEVAQAAHQIALNLITVTFMVTTGFSLAATIRVGQKLGARQAEAIRRAGFAAMGMSAGFMFITGIAIFLFRSWLPLLYIQTPEVVDLAAGLLILAALFQISDGLQVSVLGALRGMQDVKVPALFTFIAYILIGMPVSYGMAFWLDLGPTGIWIGLLAGLTLSALLNSWRFHRLTRPGALTAVPFSR